MTQLLADIAQQAALLRRPLPALGPERLLLQDRALVRLVGIGSSRHVAGYGAACLDVLGGHPASLLASPADGVPQPAFTSDQAVVVVSQSGATPSLLALAETASARGAVVVVVTNEPGSPLEQLAQVTLPCDAGAERVVPATKSVTTAMVLLRALAAPVPADALSRCADALDGLVAAGVPAAALPPAHVVCGGIAGQSVAEEVALKLAEVAGLAVVPESVVDFLHGPVAVRAPVVALVDPDDPNRAALLDRPDVHVVDVPTCGDPALDQVTRVVAGQLLAVSWAERLGVDPDDPKGLAKVTRTR